VNTEPRRLVRTAAALLIGNELLSGKITEGNLFPLAKMLRARGIQLVRVSMIADDRKQIADELTRLRTEVDLVITSGGIGPTHDDVTIEAVADSFGVPSAVHPTLAEILRGFYQERMTDDHLRMALVPAGAELRSGKDAPWPNVVMGNVWLLPGIPELFRARLAILQEHVQGELEFHTRALQLQIDEIELKPLLDQIVQAHPSVEIGSYPKWFDPTYKTKVTFDAHDSASVELALAAFTGALPAGSGFYLE
jgi:molybdenum cofactor synthesis domain-containing protein